MITGYGTSNQGSHWRPFWNELIVSLKAFELCENAFPVAPSFFLEAGHLNSAEQAFHRGASECLEYGGAGPMRDEDAPLA